MDEKILEELVQAYADALEADRMQRQAKTPRDERKGAGELFRIALEARGLEVRRVTT